MAYDRAQTNNGNYVFWVNTNPENEKEIESTGGWFNATLAPTSSTSFNVGIGVDRPADDDTVLLERKKNMCVFGNVYTKIAHKTTLAFEISRWTTGYRENNNLTTEKSNLRVQTSLYMIIILLSLIFSFITAPFFRKLSTIRNNNIYDVRYSRWTRTVKMHRIYSPQYEMIAREELKKLQLRRFQETVMMVYYRVPFYHQKMDGLGVAPDHIKTLDDVRRLPVTTKADLRDNYPFGLFAVPHEEIVRIHASSGTTGKPNI